MLKAKDILKVKKDFINCKRELKKEQDTRKRFNLLIKYEELKMKLMDIELQLDQIDIELYMDDGIIKAIFIDKYIYGFTQKQLELKYNMSIHAILKRAYMARDAFEKDYSTEMSLEDMKNQIRILRQEIEERQIKRKIYNAAMKVKIESEKALYYINYLNKKRI